MTGSTLATAVEDARIAAEIAATVNAAGFDPTLADDLTCAAVARLNTMVRNYHAECDRLALGWERRVADLGDLM
ncbi:hypothetical protein ACFSUK_28965 [Sphingobium scionense]|uniref:Uncharacterized protein n=1 Tax=Sphingobium scionense TaxID=1404341 RepID=A0A7W6LRF3_9SPHN|nr:hypothetical protein [Sphingobium scionense]MBB4147956.1 hypothetical protein [Sphingobium scionense]